MTSTISKIEPTTDPTELTALYVRAMNSGDLDTVLGLYADDAVSVWEPGNPISGAEHQEKVREYLELKPKMSATLRESHVTGDTALLVVDWVLDIPAGEDHEAEHHTGIGLDVVRKGPDGRWRYVIDNPFGDA
ncbi:YybH family protein [Actinokineospora pegani]|uniref:YybH family protein n=1 Tax=Actinokineospora pegani TaxID=2654637 RepID=UPI0012EAAC03|nr:SgcJ/EcaC family oxidoreductase [Actinokineospora pegani]